MEGVEGVDGMDWGWTWGGLDWMGWIGIGWMDWKWGWDGMDMCGAFYFIEIHNTHLWYMVGYISVELTTI